MNRTNLGEAAQGIHKAAGVELLSRGGNELDEHLSRVHSFANDEVPEIARVLGLVVGDEPVTARPLAHGVADRVTEIGGQPALLDLEHLVPASCLV